MAGNDGQRVLAAVQIGLRARCIAFEGLERGPLLAEGSKDKYSDFPPFVGTDRLAPFTIHERFAKFPDWHYDNG